MLNSKPDYAARIAAAQRTRDQLLQATQAAAEANTREHAIRGFLDGAASILSQPLAIALLSTAAALSFWSDSKKKKKETKNSEQEDQKAEEEIIANSNNLSTQAFSATSTIQVLPVQSAVGGSALTLRSRL